MSWDAWLIDDRGHIEAEFNYTHNTNAMVNAAVSNSDYTIDPTSGSWWRLLDGMEGPVGAKFLHTIIVELESNPSHYRTYDPSNGWGDYDSLLGVLKEMRTCVPEWPCTWKVTG